MSDSEVNSIQSTEIDTPEKRVQPKTPSLAKSGIVPSVSGLSLAAATSASASIASASAVAEKLPPLIVMIDDDVAFVDTIRSFFGRRADIVVLATSEDVQKYVPPRAPIMVLANINLAGSDVRADVVAFRTRFPLDRISLIALSETVDPDTTRFNRSMGFDNTFAKPIEFSVLEMYWTRAVGKRSPTGIVPKVVSAENFEERKAKILSESGLNLDSSSQASSAKLGSTSSSSLSVAMSGARRAGISGSKSDQTNAIAVPLPVSKIAGGFAAGIGVASVLSLLPWGYVYPLAALEGPLLGLLVGFALTTQRSSMEISQRNTFAMLACVAALSSTLALFAVRSGLERPFKEQNENVVTKVFAGEKLIKVAEMNESEAASMTSIPAELKRSSMDITAMQSWFHVLVGCIIAPLLAAFMVFRRVEAV